MTNSFSLVNLFTGDIVTLFISLVLVAASVMSWAIIIEKIRLWRYQRKNPVKIKSADNLDLIADRLTRPFDKNLWFLSMVSYVAPFIGLFGTIWGVMDSFASIGVNQSVSIGVVGEGRNGASNFACVVDSEFEVLSLVLAARHQFGDISVSTYGFEVFHSGYLSLPSVILSRTCRNRAARVRAVGKSLKV